MHSFQKKIRTEHRNYEAADDISDAINESYLPCSNPTIYITTDKGQ